MLRITLYIVCVILMLIFDGILIYLGIKNKPDKEDIKYHEFMKTKLCYFKLGQHVMLNDEDARDFDEVIKNVKDRGVLEEKKDEGTQ